jgi:hypothetical protein
MNQVDLFVGRGLLTESTLSCGQETLPDNAAISCSKRNSIEVRGGPFPTVAVALRQRR